MSSDKLINLPLSILGASENLTLQKDLLQFFENADKALLMGQLLFNAGNWGADRECHAFNTTNSQLSDVTCLSIRQIKYRRQQLVSSGYIETIVTKPDDTQSKTTWFMVTDQFYSDFIAWRNEQKVQPLEPSKGGNPFAGRANTGKDNFDHRKDNFDHRKDNSVLTSDQTLTTTLTTNTEPQAADCVCDDDLSGTQEQQASVKPPVSATERDQHKEVVQEAYNDICAAMPCRNKKQAGLESWLNLTEKLSLDELINLANEINHDLHVRNTHQAKQEADPMYRNPYFGFDRLTLASYLAESRWMDTEHLREEQDD